MSSFVLYEFELRWTEKTNKRPNEKRLSLLVALLALQGLPINKYEIWLSYAELVLQFSAEVI